MKSMEDATGTKFLDVPYKGLSPVIQDLLGNAVQLALVPPSLAMQLQDKGSAVALATIGGERSPMLPNVATIQEQGVDTAIMKATLWTGLVAPKGLPDAVLRRWSEILEEVVRGSEFSNSCRPVARRRWRRAARALPGTSRSNSRSPTT